MVSRERIYRLLIAGYSASQICKKTKITKGYISRIIRDLEKGGYITRINPHSKPRFYVATKKKLIRDKFTSSLPQKQERLSHRLDMVEVQKCSFICDVLFEPSKGKWDKEYVWRRGVLVQQYSGCPFRDLNAVLFRRFVSSRSDRLLVILPRICVHKSEVDGVEGVLTDYASRALRWFKKLFDMGVGNVRMCQKPHFAVVAREPELISAIDKGSFNVNGIMADKSPPSFVHEVESEDYHDIVNYLDSIKKIKVLEDKILYNQKCIQELVEKMEIMVDNQEKLIDMLKPSVFSLKPDTFKDVT